jgi:hypothetical protein
MALTVTARGSVWTTAAGNKSPSAFTPAVGDVLVVFCANSGRTTAQPPTVSDNNSDGLGAYTQVGTAMTKNTSADSGWWFMRNAPIGSASSTTVTMATASDTGGGCQVWSVGPLSAGFTPAQRTGGKGVQNNAAAGTPSLTLDATPVSASAILGAVFTGSNSSTNTAPPTSFSEASDQGYNTPTSGLEAVHRASGHTSTTVAWTAATASAFGSSAIEVKSTQAISIGLLDASPALYAPSVSMTVALGLLDASPALYAPTLVAKNLLDLTLLDAGNALYAPSLAGAAQTLTIPLLDASPSLYAPIATPTNTVTLPLLDGTVATPRVILDIVDVDGTAGWPGATSGTSKHYNNPAVVFSPTGYAVNPGDAIDWDVSTSSPNDRRTYGDGGGGKHYLFTGPDGNSANATQLYGSGMYGGYWAGAHATGTVPAGHFYVFLAFSDNIWYDDLYVTATTPVGPFAPTVIAGPVTLTLGLLDAGPTLYAPTVYQDVFVDVPLLDGANALYAPTLAVAAATATLPLLDAGNALYAPTLLPQAVSVVLGLLDGAGMVYAPSVTTTNLVTVPLLDAGNATYAPTVIPDQFVTLPLLDGSPTVYAPSLATLNALTVPLLDAGGTTYAPTLYQDQFLTVPFLDGAPALYDPVITAQGGPQTALVPLLDAGASLYAPSLLPGAIGAVLPLLDAGSALFAPTVAPGPAWVTLPMLDAAPDVYAPLLSGQAPSSDLVMPLLAAQNALYAPAITPGAVSLGLDLLDALGALYAPVLAGGVHHVIAKGTRATVTAGGIVASVGVAPVGATVTVSPPSAQVGPEAQDATVEVEGRMTGEVS